MKTAQELYNERRSRLATAMKMGKPDRIPVSLNYNAFAAQHMLLIILILAMAKFIIKHIKNLRYNISL